MRLCCSNIKLMIVWVPEFLIHFLWYSWYFLKSKKQSHLFLFFFVSTFGLQIIFKVRSNPSLLCLILMCHHTLHSFHDFNPFPAACQHSVLQNEPERLTACVCHFLGSTFPWPLATSPVLPPTRELVRSLPPKKVKGRGGKAKTKEE